MVQNAAARVLTRTRKYDHISPVMSILYWVPIIYFLFSNLADAYPKRLTNEDIIEAVKANKSATTCKCYYKSWLA